ncbi:hypothetical protein GW819_03855 [Candidatus Gracilibacteria bacterium]|nr:hypothetical protein [Candidatus Gracilibacteria bacterium]PIQ11163.1 MAG: hypothetical protein COW68_03160 [Candidatus Gracilibacteria bacterium CG18_big_fil_WC_8_21_14_2_50_38_16]PIQ40919.1 MAG: hypothetical protein COW06_04640 [Candidatus Gracilibacteria bacterium CG12_big_fil_rev_8_21_14_0_65_38_15]
MSSIHTLSKQKRRLSILFSLAIFLIILVLDIGFLSFRYLDYQKQEFGRLAIQAQGIIKLIGENSIIEQNILQGKGLTFPISGMRRSGMMNSMEGQQGIRPRIQTENFFLYNRADGKILFSPQKDDELYSSLLQRIQSKIQNGKISLNINDSEYLFLSTPITKEIGAVFFIESRMTLESVFIDILMYLTGAILLSLGVYFISSRFIDDTLAPVEENMNQMEQFIHNAGHELKTPLSVIKSSLELMRLSKNYDEGITEGIGELNRMNNLYNIGRLCRKITS